MNACLPPPRPSAYSLADELREATSAPNTYRVDVEDISAEEALLTKLGARGWGRVHGFRTYYKQPWGEKNSCAPTSPRAVEGLMRFVAQATFPNGSPPSVFLTDQGTLELCWEDAQGKVRQIEFKPDGLEYYIAATGEEGSAGWAAVSDIARRVTAA